MKASAKEWVRVTLQRCLEPLLRGTLERVAQKNADSPAWDGCICCDDQLHRGRRARSDSAVRVYTFAWGRGLRFGLVMVTRLHAAFFTCIILCRIFLHFEPALDCAGLPCPADWARSASSSASSSCDLAASARARDRAELSCSRHKVDWAAACEAAVCS